MLPIFRFNCHSTPLQNDWQPKTFLDTRFIDYLSTAQEVKYVTHTLKVKLAKSLKIVLCI